MGKFKKILSLILIAIFSMSSVCTTYASNTSHSQDAEVMDNYKVNMVGNSVRETLSYKDKNGMLVNVTRESYTDNTYVLTIEENGELTTTTGTIDYESALSFLDNRSINTLSVTYRFLGKSQYIDKISPESGKYSVILSALSFVLAPYSLPLSAISAIAAAWQGLYSGPFDMWVKTDIYTFEVYDDGGSVFLGYYRMNYYADTYKNSSCTGTPIHSESGVYESTTPG